MVSERKHYGCMISDEKEIKQIEENLKATGRESTSEAVKYILLSYGRSKEVSTPATSTKPLQISRELPPYTIPKSKDSVYCHKANTFIFTESCWQLVEQNQCFCEYWRKYVRPLYSEYYDKKGIT